MLEKRRHAERALAAESRLLDAAETGMLTYADVC